MKCLQYLIDKLAESEMISDSRQLAASVSHQWLVDISSHANGSTERREAATTHRYLQRTTGDGGLYSYISV